MRKTRFIASAVFGIAAAGAGFVRADTELFTTNTDFAGSGHGSGNAWTSTGTFTANSGAAADLDGKTVDGYGDYPSSGTNLGGTADTVGGLTLTVPAAGGFIQLSSGEEAPAIPNAAFFSALGTSGTLALDFSLPLGANGIMPFGNPGDYYQMEFVFNDSNGFEQQGDVGLTAIGGAIGAVDGSGVSNPSAGSIVYDGLGPDGNGIYTLFQNYTISPPAGDLYSYFQLEVVVNTGGSGATGGSGNPVVDKIDNIRVVSPVPEPTSMGMLLISFAGLIHRRRRT